MRYLIEFRPAARKDLRKLLRKDQIRIARRIEQLSENPRPQGVKKLSDAENLYRIRIGDYRIVYQIQDDRLIVLVVRIGHRREVYR